MKKQPLEWLGIKQVNAKWPTPQRDSRRAESRVRVKGWKM